MAKPIRRNAAEANIGGAADASSVPHKMKLRRRQALGDISSAVGINNPNVQRQQGGSNAGGRKTVSDFYHRLRVVVSTDFYLCGMGLMLSEPASVISYPCLIYSRFLFSYICLLDLTYTTKIGASALHFRHRVI